LIDFDRLCMQLINFVFIIIKEEAKRKERFMNPLNLTFFLGEISIINIPIPFKRHQATIIRDASLARAPPQREDCCLTNGIGLNTIIYHAAM
jgi:hypothetical protein